jgi:hypothetical protein
VQGNDKYRLKPVLHAGEVATHISGTIIDGSTQQAVVGGTTIVALEQKDPDGVDRVVMETVAASNGGFAFCPVPEGTYDIIAVAINGSGSTHAATVITGVQPGNVLGTVPLSSAGLPASITGQITTTGTAGTSADISLSALRSDGGSNLFTIPLAQQSAATATLTTAAGTCPTNTDCISYTLAVPGTKQHCKLQFRWKPESSRLREPDRRLHDRCQCIRPWLGWPSGLGSVHPADQT